jgi:hypothetical protein
MPDQQYSSAEITAIKIATLQRLNDPHGFNNKAAFIYVMYTLSNIDPKLAKNTSDMIKAEIVKSPQMTEEALIKLNVQYLKIAFEHIDAENYPQSEEVVR